ncbi:ribose-5-phosphate isomerase [Candidatus Wolfebacteria bacterium CG18_big_fil_WC_8_21_14_2_50_39_7]|uniref:Ribose-5-phosphate isomerase n=3 Tax=Candidatus Wolfeibacteriota TaxID=1752735 RepID=A0A2M8DAJ5_9BACT|nr:RpiB/LacA/LacB family sugar-phosphate isomerase [Candidatus Wolfebacteria bacterium]PIP92093.1 MAG: ribose-5-phosphate isomerase [Candidatus Wolfebacteria bacterium CG18_big_fil_WC_8_21_14_2_50_39_7]PIU98932.1 MAG: ribose-5-phosphate isomerase [Candidatus Wolfebacteria bacterium CG03_land_8_20_14_0_80_39_317]PJB84170.1 MAG: ribose-5-phosphate isomerase [Candidatus Wolfebacteria bacterium CG_4_9_14_0_8_um_filter_39_46]NCP58334.1 RpiB/LacA/LacB family sugar-phosphate isomerase [Candidatus Wolf
MLIYIGADHRGFSLKEIFKKILKDKGYEVVDVGNDHYDENDDYPDFAKLVGLAISQEPVNRRGILICGSGVGVDIVANKFKGVRSALVNNPDQAYLSRNDDDSNVLSLAADFLSEDDAKKILGTFLQTPFAGEGKFQRRLQKINQIET